MNKIDLNYKPNYNPYTVNNVQDELTNVGFTELLIY